MKTTSDNIPYESNGHWRLWSVSDEIRSGISPESAEIHSISGLFGGFDSNNPDDWRAVLPTLKNVRYLVSWTGANPQSLVDSIFQMAWLERLCFGSLRAKDISAIAGLPDLQFLLVHQLHGDRDLSPIGNLESLRVLEIGINSTVTDFNWLIGAGPSSLESLLVYGNRARFRVASLDPLRQLASLKYLSLPTIEPETLSLKPLLELPQLKVLLLRKLAWPEGELQDLTTNAVQVTLG